MKYIKSFNEALKPSQFRRYVKAFNRERYEEIFKNLKEKYSGDKNAYRIYIPLEKNAGTSPNPIKDAIVKLLNDNGYEVIDYTTGRCKSSNAKNESKIGRVLASLSRKNDVAKDLANKFASDPQRKATTEKTMLCLSRHPYDIAGADTDRHWTNCMSMATYNSRFMLELLKRRTKISEELYKHKNFLEPLKLEITEMELDHEDDSERYNEISKIVDDYEEKNKISMLENELSEIGESIDDRSETGGNAKYLIRDVKEGSLIAYLIKESDKNLKDPIANWNIKPFLNEDDKDDIILVSDKTGYGNITDEFRKAVDNILEEINGKKEGIYCLNDKLYDDGKDTVFRMDSNTIIAKFKKAVDSKNDEQIEVILGAFLGNKDNIEKTPELFDIISKAIDDSRISANTFDLEYDSTLSEILFSYLKINNSDESIKVIDSYLNCAKDYDFESILGLFFSEINDSDELNNWEIVFLKEILKRYYEQDKNVVYEFLYYIDDNNLTKKVLKPLLEFKLSDDDQFYARIVVTHEDGDLFLGSSKADNSVLYVCSENGDKELNKLMKDFEERIDKIEKAEDDEDVLFHDGEKFTSKELFKKSSSKSSIEEDEEDRGEDDDDDDDDDDDSSSYSKYA